MRLLPLLFMVACADLSVDEWSGAEDADTNAPPTHPLEDCPGNAPGGPVDPPGGPGGKPIPAPRDCTLEPTWEQCYDCCDWNAKNVWGETCKRMKGKSRKACWIRLENELRPQCYVSCNRPGGPITTVAP